MPFYSVPRIRPPRRIPMDLMTKTRGNGVHVLPRARRASEVPTGLSTKKIERGKPDSPLKLMKNSTGVSLSIPNFHAGPMLVFRIVDPTNPVTLYTSARATRSSARGEDEINDFLVLKMIRASCTDFLGRLPVDNVCLLLKSRRKDLAWNPPRI
ncbi:hypothetical protein PUN28_006227 [Cardiocondyla obscurior]|uniref:Uncharacterized protein n=1 Tax=Cardiocondyla obscurior TaxID=286306 RepID=A0AAW2GA59_9HYME